MKNDLVKCGERVDDLQNGYFVIQDPKKFCFGMDAVLLSGFARVKKGETVLDMGTGTGIIPILLSQRTEGKYFTGLEETLFSCESAARDGELPFEAHCEGEVSEKGLIIIHFT